ncbi:hypothetical protein BD324DRAFT_592583 [Kockovaella imperatae]|uniref:RNB domain-containing protein n=1 Tax=Kockovaella imperatae TaxID=4999 RepID=A0A1Y1UCC8_9TREE|nr:hypothetical protein BD324DRAFT_592583 [Kockovaella imperatae]ORX35669.1 hypothetical protein BD324DRAFT_592583 [Kockovaella imperatae]
MRGRAVAGPSRLAYRQLHSSVPHRDVDSRALAPLGIPQREPVKPDPRPIARTHRDESDYSSRPLKANRKRDRDDPELSDELRYRLPDIAPDVEHHRPPPGGIFDAHSPHARFPPRLAIQRSHRQNYAKSLGLHVTALNRVPEIKLVPRPDVPVRMDTAPKTKIEYSIGQGLATKEKQAYFEDIFDGNDVETGPLNGMDWAEGSEAEVDFLAPGRVVETRRSGRQNVGMILANVIVGGRVRYFVLRAYGDVWLTSANDVQYVLPSTLVKPELVGQCWRSESMDLLARGEQEGSNAEMRRMLTARQKVASVLRKVVRETERMTARIMSAAKAKGGLEGLWGHFASKDPNSRSCVTSVQAAEYFLKDGDEIQIKSGTLPAFAAHNILMKHPQLFIADPGAITETGRFLLRSQSERETLARVTRIMHSTVDEDREIIRGFVDKASRAIETSRALKTKDDYEWKEVSDAPVIEWTSVEQDLVWALLMSLYETRSTQEQIMLPILTTLLKSIPAYSDRNLDREAVALFAGEIGIVPPWETLRRSEVAEDQTRRSVLLPRSQELGSVPLRGDELDSVREDYTSHKVFVVDDAGSKELDDGVSVERIHGSDDVWIHAHIADPTRFIGPGDPLARVAAARGSAGYFQEGSVSLFGDDSMKNVSLGSEEGTDGVKAVMTFSSRVNTSGDVTDYHVNLGWVKKPRVLTYDAVDSVLGLSPSLANLRPFGTPVEHDTVSSTSTSPSSEEAKDLELIQQRMLAYRNQRMKNAGFESFLPQPSLRLSNRPPPSNTSFFSREHTPSKSSFWLGSPMIDFSVPPLESSGSYTSRQVIAEAMIMANRAAAAFCSSRKLPVPFRTCSKPLLTALPGQTGLTFEDLMKKRDPKTFVLDPFELAKTSATFQGGQLSLKPGEHWFLGFEDTHGYLRVTSPLRRYDDLLAHWQIRSALAADHRHPSLAAPRLPEDYVKQIMLIADSASKDNRNAGRFSSSWWTALLIRDRMANPRPGGYIYDSQSIDPNEPLEAIIAMPPTYTAEGDKLNSPVLIPALGTLARLVGSKHEEVGDRIKVRIQDIALWPKPLVSVIDA